MTLDKFIAAFQYKADGRLDSWRILQAGGAGDCDDHAVTAAYLYSNGTVRMFWGVLTRRVAFYWCWTNEGQAHVIVWLKGAGYVDNIEPRISDKRQHKWNIRLPLLFVMFKMLMGKLT